MKESEWPVHEGHCCPKHGCKYGDEDCPVTNRLTTKYNHHCEFCEEDFNNPSEMDLFEAWYRNAIKIEINGKGYEVFPTHSTVLKIVSELKESPSKVAERGKKEGWWKKI